MRELSDSFERITHIPRKKPFILLNSSRSWGSRDAFKKTLRIYSSPQKCGQMRWETNAPRRCNDVKQYAKLHFLKYCPMWIFKSSFSSPVFVAVLRKSNWFTQIEICLQYHYFQYQLNPEIQERRLGRITHNTRFSSLSLHFKECAT